MKKCRFYHGTVAGKDDVFLESFIATGAVSNKTKNPVQQEGGFYVSLHPRGWAYGFSRTQDEPPANQPLRYGRGMIIEFEAELNAVDWDIDHEFFQRSMEIIKHFKDELPSLAFNTEDSSLKNLPTRDPFFIKQGETKDKITIHFKDLNGKEESAQVSFDDPNTLHLFGYTPTFFLEQIHIALQEKFPERYLRAKQEVIDSMVEEGFGDLKYVGDQPLRASRIYLRPLDCPFMEPAESKCVDSEGQWDEGRWKEQLAKWEKNPLGRWEVVYSRGNSAKESLKPASPRRSPAVPRP